MSGNNASFQNAAGALQPVGPSERILALDVLRGFALFGVLVAYAVWNLGSPPEQTQSEVDLVLDRVLSALVDTKAYTLFAVMFGLGFSIQLTRATARGVRVVPVYLRRLLALLLIGLAHALLLRNGDILVPYAVMGFFLLLFRNASNRTLAIGAIIGLLFPYFAVVAWELTGIPFAERPDTAGIRYLAENFAWVRYWYSSTIILWPASLPMFLFGLYLGRRRLFENLSAHRNGLRRVRISGLVVGVLALAGIELLNRTWTHVPQPFAQRIAFVLLRSVHAWGLAAFYASSLLLLLRSAAWQRRLAPLGAVGRMALTNYLLQAVLIVPLCIAFGLFDRVTPSIGLLLALGVWTLQLPASVWWLNCFQFGPAEWVWRSLTYGRPQQMRTVRKQSATVTA
ncbi:MAG: DUF418 domain-containing protein [Blastocatellia bacterium]